MGDEVGFDSPRLMQKLGQSAEQRDYFSGSECWHWPPGLTMGRWASGVNALLVLDLTMIPGRAPR